MIVRYYSIWFEQTNLLLVFGYIDDENQMKAGTRDSYGVDWGLEHEFSNYYCWVEGKAEVD